MSRLETRLRHLPERDLAFIVETVLSRRTDTDHVRELVKEKPDFIDIMLENDRLAERILTEDDIFLRISPYLLFTILLRRARRDLANSSFTLEQMPGGKLPIFDAPKAASLLQNNELLHYLAEMLAGFLRNETYTVFVRRGRYVERHSFSELDLDDMIALAELAPERDRFLAHRRVADLALFLVGLFDEYVVAVDMGGSRSAGRTQWNSEAIESLGRRYYELAAESSDAYDPDLVEVLSILAEHFTLAKKPLNLIAQRYIAGRRHPWFRKDRHRTPPGQ